MTNKEITYIDEPTNIEYHDEIWHSEYLKLSIKFNILRAIGIGVKETNQIYEDFLKDPENYKPDFRTRGFSLEELNEFKDEYEKLKKRIQEEEKNPAVRLAYVWVINQKINEIKFTIASTEGNMESVRIYGKALYGEISKEEFIYTLAKIQNQIDQAKASDNPELKAKAEELENKLKNDLQEKNTIKNPSKETFEKTKTLISEQYHQYLKDIDEESEYTKEELKTIFEGILIKLDFNNWTVEITDKTQNIKVIPAHKKIQIPDNKERTFKGFQVKKLILHEILSHAKRSENGNKSSLKLLELGLHEYANIEEGIAILHEQSQNENFTQYASNDNHLLIGLSKGLLGINFNFQELYEIMKTYYEFQALKKGTNVEKAGKESFDRLLRIFRGTDCKDTSINFPKDKAYREGNIKIWEMISEKPELFRIFTIGKYDPTNPTHWWILVSLNIIEKELAEKYLNEIEYEYTKNLPKTIQILLENYKREIFDTIQS